MKARFSLCVVVLTIVSCSLLYASDFVHSSSFSANDTMVVGDGDKPLVYEWFLADGSSPCAFSFRLDDGPWYIGGGNISRAVFLLEEGVSAEPESHVFQIKASLDGVHWTGRATTYDPTGLYEEDNLPTQGWTIRAQAGALWPFMAAFLVPKRSVVAYYNSNRLKTAVSAELGASYETKGGDGYGLSFQYTFTPTDKEDAFEVYSLEFLYSSMLCHARRYEAFQLSLEVGLGPALCIYGKVGSFGFRARVGLSSRVEIADGLSISTGLDVNAAIEPDFHKEDEVRVGTTLYLTLPLRVGLVYSFKEVAD